MRAPHRGTRATAAAGGGRAPYTILTNGQLRGLHEAGASASEVLAYAMLTRWHNDPEHPARCWHAAQLAADALGMRPDAFSRALSGLTTKAFADDEGGPITVLSRVVAGHRGMAAVYNDNLYALAVLNDPSQVARRPRRAAGQDSSSISSGYRGRESSPIPSGCRWRDSSAIRTELPDEIAAPLDRTKTGGGAVPDRNRTAPVSQPHKPDPEAKKPVTVSGLEDAPAGNAVSRRPQLQEGCESGRDGGQGFVTSEQFSRLARLLGKADVPDVRHEQAGSEQDPTRSPLSLQEGTD